jgi:hypothetical protein
MEQSKAMEYESWMASSDVLKLRNVYIYIYIYIFIRIKSFRMSSLLHVEYEAHERSQRLEMKILLTVGTSFRIPVFTLLQLH